jgi:hypothetical protein
VPPQFLGVTLLFLFIFGEHRWNIESLMDGVRRNPTRLIL